MRLQQFAAALALLPALVSVPAFGATSSFSSGAEGWSAIGDVQGALSWSSTGGNPGGYVFIDDLTTGGVTYFVAPSSFLGNMGGAYGSALTFDLRQAYSGGANQFNASDVLLQGAGLTLAYDLPTNPANGTWTSFSVPLAATSWHLNTLTGAVATAEQVQAVLAGLTSLRIRAEYQTGPDIGSLDNVSMVPEPGSLALFAAGSAIVLVVRKRRTRS